MEDIEKKAFLHYLNYYTPEYRQRLLKKLKTSSKNIIRAKTRKYIKEKNIKLDKCIFCGSEGYIEIHHINYDYPLLVSPVCKTCHGKQHRKNNKNIKYIDLTTMEVHNG